MPPRSVIHARIVDAPRAFAYFVSHQGKPRAHRSTLVVVKISLQATSQMTVVTRVTLARITTRGRCRRYPLIYVTPITGCRPPGLAPWSVM